MALATRCPSPTVFSRISTLSTERLMLLHPQLNVISNDPTGTQTSDSWCQQLSIPTEPKLPVLGPNGPWMAHHHRDGGKRCRPFRCSNRKHMPVRTLGGGVVAIIFLVIVILLCYTSAVVVVVVYWRQLVGGSTDIGWWFFLVKPSKDPVCYISTSLYVPFLNVPMNPECYIKYNSCPPG